MQSDRERPQLGGPSGTRGPGVLGTVLGKVIAVVAGAAILVGTVAVSIVVFAIALAGILVFGGYIWWKTRALRRQLRGQTVWEQSRRGPSPHDPFDPSAREERTPGGTIIEGEVLRKSDRDEEPNRSAR